jgi:transposase
LFFLPPYSPELNPDKWVLVQSALSDLKGTPEKLLAFFGDPDLAYIAAAAQG